MNDFDSITSFFIYLLAVWLFINIVYTLFKERLEARGFKIYYGVVLVYRKGFNPRSRRILKKVSPLWFIPFILALIMFYTAMISNTLVKLHIIPGKQSVQLLVPGINITGIDLLYFALSVLIAAIIHELSHAYTARSHGLKTKNIGFAVLFFIPVAFVEIDEEEFSKASLLAKLSILAAGPASNLLLGLLVMLILSGIASSYGLLIVGVEPGSLADKAGLSENMVIYSINNEPATLSTLRKYLELNETVNLSIKVYVPGEGFRIYNVTKPANTHILGVYLRPAPRIDVIKLLGLDASLILYSLITWLYIVNISLAIINAAPIFVSDGGRIIYELSRDKRIGTIINTATLILLITALTPY